MASDRNVGSEPEDDFNRQHFGQDGIGIQSGEEPAMRVHLVRDMPVTAQAKRHAYRA